MCGENNTISIPRVRNCGSPPRVRGKPCHSTTPSPHTRITPACAGKTLPPHGSEQRFWDHPRVCGENSHRSLENLDQRGSPPRVRGKRCRSSRKLRLSRITPACAGKTGAEPLLPARARDHPRVCGENKHSKKPEKFVQGSPPRVRGKRPARAWSTSAAGITPACAGKTQRVFTVASGEGDHPRVCGENDEDIRRAVAEWGSPPRVRGKPSSHSLHFQVVGITPACAGKTHQESPERRLARDHPRVCGENCWKTGDIKASVGSPPRMRGKPSEGATALNTGRITPAHAGKTAEAHRHRSGGADHPRACGENSA